MSLMHLPRVVAWDATLTQPAANGTRVYVYAQATGGSAVQTYNASGNPVDVFVEGFTVPDIYVQDMNGAWLDAGAGRYYVEAVEWVQATLATVNSAVATVGSFEARLAAVEAGGGGGGTGGGSQLGLIEDVFMLAAENGSTLVGANGTIVSRTSFTYGSVPTGHRLAIYDHPDFAGSSVQPQLPAAFWGEASKTNPLAIFISGRTPVAG